MFSLFLLGVTPPATEVGRNSSATAHSSAGSCRDYFSATCHYLNQELLQNTQILNPTSVKNAAGCFPPTAMTSFVCSSWRCWDVSNAFAQMPNEMTKKSTFWHWSCLNQFKSHSSNTCSSLKRTFLSKALAQSCEIPTTPQTRRKSNQIQGIKHSTEVHK